MKLVQYMLTQQAMLKLKNIYIVVRWKQIEVYCTVN